MRVHERVVAIAGCASRRVSHFLQERFALLCSSICRRDVSASACCATQSTIYSSIAFCTVIAYTFIVTFAMLAQTIHSSVKQCYHTSRIPYDLARTAMMTNKSLCPLACYVRAFSMIEALYYYSIIIVIVVVPDRRILQDRFHTEGTLALHEAGCTPRLAGDDIITRQEREGSVVGDSSRVA